MWPLLGGHTLTTHCFGTSLLIFSFEESLLYTYTGCSLNIVFFPKILEYSVLWPFSVFPWCQCEYTHQAGKTPALQKNWQSSERSQNIKEKHNI